MFTGNDANTAIINLVIDSPLPTEVKERIRATVVEGNRLKQLIETMEAIYADMANCPIEAVQLLEELSSFIADKEFMGQGDRAAIINAEAIAYLEAQNDQEP